MCSVEFKRAAVQKYLNRGNRKVADILQEIGIRAPTLYQWRNEFARVHGMTKPIKPKDRSPKDKLKAIMEFDALPVEKRGEFLRKNGLHEEHLESWRQQIEDALSGTTSKTDRLKQTTEQKKIKTLEKELRRKEKALAEASALLILKKKADLIWGEEEDE